MVPDRPVSPVPVLQKIGGMQGFLPVRLVFFGLLAGSGVNLFQFSDGKWRFFRIFSLEILLEIRKLRLTFLQLCNDQSHLIAPVSQVDIPQNLMAHFSCDPFDTLPDNGRAEMPYMERLCHIGSAVIHQDHLRIFHRIKPQSGILSHLI